MATIAQLNRKIAHTGIECYKADGYFYFMGVRDDVPVELEPRSVYSNTFSTMTLSEWVDYVEDHIRQVKGH